MLGDIFLFIGVDLFIIIQFNDWFNNDQYIMHYLTLVVSFIIIIA